MCLQYLCQYFQQREIKMIFVWQRSFFANHQHIYASKMEFQTFESIVQCQRQHSIKIIEIQKTTTFSTGHWFGNPNDTRDVESPLAFFLSSAHNSTVPLVIRLPFFKIVYLICWNGWNSTKLWLIEIYLINKVLILPNRNS